MKPTGARSQSDSNEIKDNKNPKMKNENAHTRTFGGHRILLTKLSYQTFVRRRKKKQYSKTFHPLIKREGLHPFEATTFCDPVKQNSSFVISEYKPCKPQREVCQTKTL